MTKADLVEEISAKTGVSKNHTALIVDDLLEVSRITRSPSGRSLLAG